MAYLVTCGQCNTEYLDKSKACPNCGAGVRAATNDKSLGIEASHPSSRNGNIGFFASLFDFKFETYITKRVASVVYAVLSVVIAIATVLATLYTGWLFIESWEWMQYAGFTWIPLLSFVATPFIGLLTIIAIRLTFETSIALVDIAQNTKK